MTEALLVVGLLLAMWVSTLVKDPPVKYKLETIIVRFTVNTQNFASAMEGLGQTFQETTKHIEEWARIVREQGELELEGRWEVDELPEEQRHTHGELTDQGR